MKNVIQNSKNLFKESKVVPILFDYQPVFIEQ